MNTHLPADLEQFIQAKVRNGRFTSFDEAMTAAVRLLRQQEEAEEARTLEGIRQGLEDMRAGRGRPAEEVFADIRREFNVPSRGLMAPAEVLTGRVIVHPRAGIGVNKGS